MAMGSTSSGGRSRRGRRSRRRGALSEINVTPMVDVMLVLLIIFMISAPLLASGIKLELPKTEAAAMQDEGDPLTVSIQRDGAIYVQNDPATFDQLVPRIEAISGGDTSKAIYVRAEGAASYETVARVMARLSTSGYGKINLMTEGMGAPETAAPATAQPEVTP